MVLVNIQEHPTIKRNYIYVYIENFYFIIEQICQYIYEYICDMYSPHSWQIVASLQTRNTFIRH
jgi:hypothetical protein